DEVGDLRNYKIGITDSGMLYKQYVARQMNPKRWMVPFIGKKSIEIQINNIEKELRVISAEISNSEYTLEQCNYLSQVDFYKAREIDGIKAKLRTSLEIVELSDDIAKLEQQRDKLDLTYLVKLDEKINKLRESIEKINKNRDGAHSQKGKYDEQKNQIERVDIPNKKNIVNQYKSNIDVYFNLEWIESIGDIRYEKEINKKPEQQIADDFKKAKIRQETLLSKEMNFLERLRREYNQLYHMSYNVEEENNFEFERAFKVLSENKLPDYLEKIATAKDQASIQFKDEFLAKLKENFDTVSIQLNELNSAIKSSSFGNDYYKFEAKPKPEYKHFYDMVMDPLLLTKGFNIMSNAFTEKHSGAIDELFTLITEVDESTSMDTRIGLEKNIKFYTDYRSYLNFDLLVSGEDGKVQRLSKTLLKKSGGETQTPFYISVLASFAQMYRINQTGKYNNTVRLIIFDEAFSKMDSQRIRKSLELLRKFGLQAVLSAPPEKIPDVTPYVDQNLCVFRQENHSFIKSYTKKEMMVI
ncbi:MAG: SbcC/MukB-like Walker B domain-containing protein, partial [Bacillota bacterium]|nr:SbcC/MukB-like Walker B domain-containing protein [Bacillota bacterium]